MKSFIVIATMAMGMTAHADGFKCQTESGLNIQVYNQTDAHLGTRSGATMVVSDESIQYGHKTIAKFTAAKKTLSSSSLRYVARVDLRVSESNRAGELIAGTKLGYVSQLVLDIAFSYSKPTAHKALMPAQLTVVKRNGTYSEEAAVCERYLKN